MITRVPVAPSVLHWAQDRSGRGAPDFENRFSAWDAWITGASSPTVKQVEELAHYAHLPFGVFFLTEPPHVELPIPDYRLGVAGGDRAPSQELLEVVDTSIQRQAWFRDYALANDLGVAEIEQVSNDIQIVDVARKATIALRFSVSERGRMKREEVRNHLRHRFEELGGLAIFTSMVGNNTTRPLDRDEFRGFTLADDVAPLIFVNTHDDTLAGQIFTFLHEFAHVMTAQTGVSDEDPRARVDAGIEAWCNQVAAEILIPADDLRATFRAEPANREELDRLAMRYHCSTLVVLLRLRDGHLISASDFSDRYEAELRHIDEVLAQRPKSSGGDFYRNQPFRIGERFSRAVLRQVYSGATSYTDAFALLGLRSANQLDSYARQLGLR